MAARRVLKPGPVRKADEAGAEPEERAKADGTHKLEGLKVHEVSVVRRAANKRVFAIVKADEPTATSAGAGAAEVAKASPALAAALSPLAVAKDRLAVLVADLEKGVGTGAGGDLGAANLAGEIESIARELFSIGSGLSPAVSNDYAIAAAAKSGAAAAAVEKVGAKMSQQRLERLLAAVSTLQELVGEVATKKEPGQSAAEKTAPVTKSADAPPPAADPAIASKLDAIAQNLGALAAVVKSHDDLFGQLRNAPGATNALPFEAGPAPAADEAGWPTDLNWNVGRGQVKKEHSFYGSAERGKE